MTKHRAPRLLTTIGAVTIIGALAACSSNADGAATQNSASTDAATTAAVAGGDYVHALENDPGCLDGAQQRYHVAFNIIRQATDSLVDLDPETGEIVPWLAESWDINDDATAFTFTLKDGVTFSNGEAFDGEAVKANFDRIIDLGAKAVGAAPVLAGYTGTEVIDPLTVTVTFDQPNIQFLQGLSAAWLGLISPSDTTKSAEELCTGDWSGTGPFVLDSYTKDDKAVLSKRVGYDWPSEAYHHTGEAYLDTLTFTFLPESAIRTGALLSGDVNSISLVPAQDEATITGSGGNLLVTQPPGLELTWIANQQSTFGSDATVREAIALALDREELTTLYGSGWAPATSILGPTTPYFTDFSDLIVHDGDKAKQLLDDAGWTVGADGIREKDGQKLSISVIIALPEQAELVQQQLAEVGIDYQIRKLDTAATSEALAAGDYDFYVWNMTRAEPDVLRGIFASGGGGQNYSKALPSEVDALLTAQAAAVDPAQRQELVDQAVEYLITNNLAIPSLIRAWTYGYAAGVEGFSVDGEAKLVFYDTSLAA